MSWADASAGEGAGAELSVLGAVVGGGAAGAWGEVVAVGDGDGSATGAEADAVLGGCGATELVAGSAGAGPAQPVRTAAAAARTRARRTPLWCQQPRRATLAWHAAQNIR